MIISDIVLTSLLVLQMLFVDSLSIQTVFLSLVIHSKVSLFLKILLQIFDSIHIILILILLLFALLVLVNSLSCLSFLDLVSIHYFLLHVLEILCFVLPIYIYLILTLSLLLSISLVFSLCSKCSSNVFEYIIISSMYTTTNSSNQSFNITFIIL